MLRVAEYRKREWDNLKTAYRTIYAEKHSGRRKLQMVIQHNLLAMYGNRMLGKSTRASRKSTEKLSSGYKINCAGDNAAGLAISEKMRGQIRGLDQGVKNTLDGISLCQVADGALSEVNDMLHRIRELSVQSSNDTNADDDRTQIQAEVEQIIREIDRIGNTTEFNTMPLFKGCDELVRNADGSPFTYGGIPIADFSLVDLSLGRVLFGNRDGANHLALQAIVNNPASMAYGTNYNLIYGNGSTSSVFYREVHLHIILERACRILFPSLIQMQHWLFRKEFHLVLINLIHYQ